jgi:hypothetical protein
VRGLGDVMVKGKSRPVKIFEVALPASVNRALNVYSPLASPADKDKAAAEASKSKE